MNLLFIGKLFGYAFGILMLLITVYSIYHIVTNRNLSNGERVVWIMVVLVLNVIGSVIYLALNSSKKAA